MNNILGMPPEWRITSAAGANNNARIEETEGNRLVTAGIGGLIIESPDKLGVDKEVVIRFRLSDVSEKSRSAVFEAGVQTKNKDKNCLSLSMNAAAGADQIQLAMPPVPGKPAETLSPYVIRRLPKNRLAWPERVRVRVEAESAAQPSLSEHWLTIRYVIREHSSEVWLDDRLLREIKQLDVTGGFRANFSEGVQLANISVHSLPSENPQFMEVPLNGYLNASQFQGDRIRFETLPKSGTSIVIGGIPFKLPSRDYRGNDHIDIGKSWMPFGSMEGEFDPQHGDIPRWRGPLLVQPSRITFQVPNDSYSDLYLLAASDGGAGESTVVTAQFFRANAGHPVDFASNVPLFEAGASGNNVLPVELTNGKKGHLYLIKIPLQPEGLASLSDQNQLVFELTKSVQTYRACPDPMFYSRHGAGLPSGVHVYAMTLGRPVIEIDLQPNKYAHIWTAPEQPSYSLNLQNITNVPQKAEVRWTSQSYDGSDRTEMKKPVHVPASGRITVNLPLKLNRYGYHHVELQVSGTADTQTQTRSLAYLHPNTRERREWREGEGPLWGFWDWNGAHGTPGGKERLEVALAAGIKSVMRPLVKTDIGVQGYTPGELAFAEEYGMKTNFLAYQLAPARKRFLGTDFDPTKPKEMEIAVTDAIKKSPLSRPSKTNDPKYAVFFAEPTVGPVSMMSFPEYYGDPPYEMTSDEQVKYQTYLDQFVIAGRAIKKEWPDARLYLPWGIASFPIAFLRNSKEATELMDGPAVDQVLFERLPEMQIGQITFSSVFWQLKQEWIKAGKPWPPSLISIEGGGLTSPATPGGLTMEEEAERTVRGELLLFPYGINQHLGWPSLFRCAAGWGEQHYGSGLCEAMPILSPKPAYSAYAAMTRQLDGMNYVKAVPTGSASVFCLQFQHYKTKELLHVFWTLRGKRPITLEASAKVLMYDSMDNLAEFEPKAGKATISIGSAPSYVRGLGADAKMVLGEPDHSDAKPAELTAVLGNPGDGTWQRSDARDLNYENSNPVFIRRFPGNMSVAARSAPEMVGGKALGVHLQKQEKERRVMPFYTTLTPAKPIEIPGKPSHLGLWVWAASDWGRVVYCLRDAKGEQWISVGKKDEWNQDDPHCWSQFCFDGWRYLRFELPGNQPWDKFKDAGTSWWGYYGDGDGVVDLPLSLEKIFVERRTHVIKVDELEPADPAEILLGNLYAEYEAKADNSAEAVRLSRLEMPMPDDLPTLENPIQKMLKSGEGRETSITKVAPPERQYDGTQCHVFFDPVEGAKSYEIWASTYPDGRGAVCLGQGWKAPGQLLTGLPSGVEIYLFVSYTDAVGKLSKPSAPKRILLKDDFPFK